MAKKKSAPHEKHINTAIPYIAVLSVIAIAIFLVTTTQRNLEVKNQLETKARERLELMSKGINPDPVSIRQVSLSGRWETSPFSYESKAAYLLSDIADFGDKRDDLKIGTENKFLVVQMDVAYIKAQGAKQDININRYVRVMANGRSYQPVSADTIKLGPNQNTTSYVIFAVPMTASEFSISTGNKTTKVDFSAQSVESMEGVFTTTGGYASEFK